MGERFHIVHDRFGCSSDPSLSEHLHYPNDLDGPLNEVDPDKIRQYHPDYYNRSSNTISFIPSVVSTSGWLHCEFVLLLFFQDYRETDRFLSDTGVQIAETTFHCGKL